MLQQIDLQDKQLSHRIHIYESQLCQICLYPFAKIFNPEFIAIPLILIFYIKDLNYALTYGIQILVILLISTLMKQIFARPRPQPINSQKSMNIRAKERNFSMPSGDSMQAGGFVFHIFKLSFDLVNIQLFVIGVVFLIMVMLARIYFCCHYIADTIVGAIGGILISFFTYLILF